MHTISEDGRINGKSYPEYHWLRSSPDAVDDGYDRTETASAACSPMLAWSLHTGRQFQLALLFARWQLSSSPQKDTGSHPLNTHAMTIACTPADAISGSIVAMI